MALDWRRRTWKMDGLKSVGWPQEQEEERE